MAVVAKTTDRTVAQPTFSAVMSMTLAGSVSSGHDRAPRLTAAAARSLERLRSSSGEDSSSGGVVWLRLGAGGGGVREVLVV